MADHDVYCEALVREADKDRFLATLFAPVRYRPALFALYAFEIEVGRVASLVREPMAGEIRLQWWRDVITGDGHSGGSPVATGLIEAMQTFHLRDEELIDVIDTHGAALHRELSFEDLDRAMARAAGLIFTLAARVLDESNDANIRPLGDNAGIARVLSQKFAASGGEERRDRIRTALLSAGDLLRQNPEKLWPAFLVLALVPPVLAGKSLPQWRRQWILWRAARNLPKALAQ